MMETSEISDITKSFPGDETLKNQVTSETLDITDITEIFQSVALDCHVIFRCKEIFVNLNIRHKWSNIF